MNKSIKLKKKWKDEGFSRLRMACWGWLCTEEDPISLGTLGLIERALSVGKLLINSLCQSDSLSRKCPVVIKPSDIMLGLHRQTSPLL